MSYLLLLSIKGKTDLNNILREYGSLQCDPKELYRIFKTATEKHGDELPFLKVNCNQVKKMLLNLAETILISYHLHRRFDFYQVENNIVLTREGVVVPVKKIVNVCIKPVALTFT